jgi:hypothetical protein
MKACLPLAQSAGNDWIAACSASGLDKKGSTVINRKTQNLSHGHWHRTYFAQQGMQVFHEFTLTVRTNS